MSVFSFTYAAAFGPLTASGSFPFIDSDDSGGILVDDEPGVIGSFLDGEDVTDGAFDGTFAETYVAGGRTFLVIETTYPVDPFDPLSGQPIYVVYADGSGFTFSAGDSLDPSAIVPPPGVGIVVCFAAGTGIATPTGEVAVERLAPGDPVLTADGWSAPVHFLFRQTLHSAFTPADRFCPVVIRAGALGEGLPRRDLIVTADHGIAIDGVLVNAGALVNGRTIVRMPAEAIGKSHVVYHIETAGHDLVLAHGVPCETFLDDAARAAFDNHGDYLAVAGEPATGRKALALPRVMSRRQLPAAIRARLQERAAAVEGSPLAPPDRRPTRRPGRLPDRTPQMARPGRTTALAAAAVPFADDLAGSPQVPSSIPAARAGSPQARVGPYGTWASGSVSIRHSSASRRQPISVRTRIARRPPTLP